MAILLGIALAVIAGFVPMVSYAAIMWWVDRYEKEPWYLIGAAFLWGAVPSIVLALIAQIFGGLAFGIGLGAEEGLSLSKQLLMASVMAPVTEEIAKGLALLGILLFFRHEIDSLLDGVVYGSIVGFGFAATENVLYGLQALGQAGIAGVLFLGFLRSVVFGLAHAFFTSLTGVGIALARHGKTASVRWLGPILGLGGAMFAHGLHNLGATLVQEHVGWLGFSFLFDWGGVAGIAILILVTLSAERRWIETELAEEVAEGILSPGEAALLASSWRRLGALWRGSGGGGPVPRRNLYAFFSAATELAFTKRHMRELGDDPTARERLDRLRAAVQAARPGGSGA